MQASDSSKHPLRLAIFEGLQSSNDLNTAFASSLGIEEAIVILPPQSALQKLEIDADWRNDPKIEWIEGVSVDEMPSRLYRALIKRNRHFIMRASGFIESESSKSHKSYFESARKSFHEITDLIEMGRGYLESGLISITNTLENMDMIEANPGVESLRGLFKGVPAVIVSTGPSLPASLEDLKKIQDRCLIISADASLKILLAAGIKPHLVCTIEREEGTLQFYKNAMNEIEGDKPHILTFTLTPRAVVNEMQGPLWFAYRNMSYFGLFEAQVPRGVIAAGHSVAHSCARLARFLDCSEIVLIGQDLAYDPDNFSSHSKGFSYSEATQKSSLAELTQKIEARGEKLSYIPGNRVAEVPTSTYYLMFLREFEALVRDIGIPVRNATRGGAKISGAEYGELLDFSKNWNPLSEIFEKLNRARKISTAPNSFRPELILKITEEPLALLRQCSEILQRQMPYLSESNARSVLITMAQELRSVQRRLLEDDIFRSLTIDLIGARFVKIENQIALCNERDEASLVQRFTLLLEWFTECKMAIEKFRDLLLKFEFKNKKVAGSSRDQ